jgi:hypothetical protein
MLTQEAEAFWGQIFLFLQNSIFVSLGQWRPFWKLRQALIRAGFLGHREFFRLKHHVEERRADAYSFIHLVKPTLPQISLALVSASILQATDPLLVDLYKSLEIKIPDADQYGTLLATAAGVGGVFIGLYYAAISAVGGAIYARVPNNIRDLLARERLGNVYMQFLSIYTYLTVALLALQTVNFPPIVLTIPLLIIGSGISIVAFAQLGARAFNFFDPTAISYSLFGQLQRSIERIVAGGHRWADQSFQSHAHKLARAAVDTLSTLADIAASEPHLNGAPLANLANSLLKFLVWYEPAKRKIPGDSLWYARRYIHSDWYRTEDSTTSLIHRVNGSLPPKSASNTRWLEEDILPIVLNCISTNFQLKRYDIVREVLMHLRAYIEMLVKEGQAVTAFQLIDDVVEKCSASLFAPIPAGESRESLEQLGMIGEFVSLPISVLLAFVKSREQNSRSQLVNRLRFINWRQAKSIYSAGLPLCALPQLEWLRPRLDFELRSEGCFISPQWYIAELVLQPICEELKLVLSSLFKRAQSLFEKWTEESKKTPTSLGYGNSLNS